MPWQETLIKGFRTKEMAVISAGRQMGKSYVNQIMRELMEGPKFRKTTGAIVDGEQWYTVRCHSDVGQWVRTQNPNMWYEHIDQNWTVYVDTFDVHEKIYTMMGVKFA